MSVATTKRLPQASIMKPMLSVASCDTSKAVNWKSPILNGISLNTFSWYSLMRREMQWCRSMPVIRRGVQ